MDLFLSVDWRAACGFTEVVCSDRISFCLTGGGRGCKQTDILVHRIVLETCIIRKTHSSVCCEYTISVATKELPRLLSLSALLWFLLVQVAESMGKSK